MDDFRVKPIDVPEDWHYQSLDLVARLTEQTRAKIEALGYDGNEAEAEAVKTPIVISELDILEYFETLLSVPEVADARKKLVPWFYADPTLVLTNPEWAEINRSFRKWWLLTRFDLNGWGMTKIDPYYSGATTEALNDYFQNGDIISAYQKINEKCKEFGVSIRGNSEEM